MPAPPMSRVLIDDEPQEAHMLCPEHYGPGDLESLRASLNVLMVDGERITDPSVFAVIFPKLDMYAAEKYISHRGFI